MKNNIFKFLFGFLFITGILVSTSCKKDEEEEEPKVKPELLTFKFTNAGVDGDMEVIADIDGTDITATVTYNTDLTALKAEATLSEGASITPANGTALDYSEARNFVVSNGEEDKIYTVTVYKTNEPKIMSFEFVNTGADQNDTVACTIDGTEITALVSFDTDVTALKAAYTVVEGSVITPDPAEALDYTEAQTLVVTNDGESLSYTVTVTLKEADMPELTSLELLGYGSETVYESTVDLINDKILVSYYDYQSSKVVVNEISVSPEGTVYETSTGNDTIDLASETAPTITLSFADKTRVLTFEPTVIVSGFDASTVETLFDKSAASGLVPTEIADDKSRGADFNGQYVFVASRLNGNFVHYWDIEATVDEIQNLSMTGVEGGSWVISDVKCSNEAIYACNMVMAAADAVFKVYRWANVDAEPEVILTWSTTADNQRLGDALSIIGDPTNDGYIISSNFPGYGGLADASQMFVFKATAGEFGEPTIMDFELTSANKIGQYGRMNAIPGTDKWLFSGAEAMVIIDATGTIHYEIPTEIVQGRAFDGSVFEYNGATYLSYTVNRDWEENGAFTKIINISEGADAVEGIKNLNAENIEAKVAYTKSFGAPADVWVNAVNEVVFDENGDPVVFGFSVLNGFIVEKFTK